MEHVLAQAKRYGTQLGEMDRDTTLRFSEERKAIRRAYTNFRNQFDGKDRVAISKAYYAARDVARYGYVLSLLASE